MNMNLLEMNDAKVTFGSTATVRDLETGEIETFTLVSPSQADIAMNRISSTTPLAHAIYGRGAGDEVEVLAPGGAIRLLIEAVRSEPDDDYG
jgi:transcription elongation factor GreA